MTLAADPLQDALFNQFGLADVVVDDASLANSVARFREQGIVLPTFAQLADPSTVDPAVVAGVDKDAPDARNLWRVHWYNDLAGGRVEVPDHVVLPPSLTGVESPIIVAFGDRFLMITAPGARRPCLPRTAGRDRPVRSHPASGDLAEHRQLRPRRHRDQPDHGQPRRGDPAGGHEPGALRLA
ncbi:MAG: hypothetical protein R2713_20400 [Ilumatobacteraceae bacterium]